MNPRKLMGLSLTLISVSCWHSTGHFLTALIAQKEIEKQDDTLVPYLVSVLKILTVFTSEKQNPFIEEAEFPDQIKYLNWKSFDSWHFHDIYIYAPDAPNKDLPVNPENVVWAINECRETLTNQKVNQVDVFLGKSFMLRYLVHLVGDIHQPLHNASLVSKDFPDGDAGGNNFSIDYPGAHDLHTFWDSCLKQYKEIKTPLDKESLDYLMELADDITGEYTREKLKDKLSVNSPADWSVEAQQIAKDFVYAKIHVNDKPSDEYIKDGLEIVREQLALGGYRLADMLLEIFTPDNRKPVSFKIIRSELNDDSEIKPNKIHVETD